MDSTPTEETNNEKKSCCSTQVKSAAHGHHDHCCGGGHGGKGGGKGKGFRKFLLIMLGISVYCNFLLYTLFSAATGGGVTASLYQEGPAETNIAIVPIKGAINGDQEAFVRNAFEYLDKAEHLPKAIVLRVNSPGGDPWASDHIWQTIVKFKKKHPNVPIIGSIGAVCASGGYYSVVGADHIMAEPISLVGSVGVISMNFTMDKMMEKIGIEPSIMIATDSPKKDIANNPFRWDERDKKKQLEIMDYLQKQFIHVVSSERVNALGEKTTAAKIASACDGSLYRIEDAIDKQFVDSKGYLDDAIALAAKTAGIDDVKNASVNVISQGGSGSLLSSLLGMSTKVQNPLDGITAKELNQHSLNIFDPKKIRETLIDSATPRFEFRSQLHTGE